MRTTHGATQGPLAQWGPNRNTRLREGGEQRKQGRSPHKLPRPTRRERRPISQGHVSAESCRTLGRRDPTVCAGEGAGPDSQPLAVPFASLGQRLEAAVSGGCL